MPEKEYRIVVELDSKKGKKGAKDLDRSVSVLNRRIGRISPLAAAAGVAMAGLFARSVINAAKEQELAIAKMEAVLKSTEGVSGATSGAIQQFAAELQELTGIGDETTIAMSSVLLTFTNLQGDVLPRTIKAVQDVSTIMGTDFTSQAVQLGKALNDPVANLGALGRVGIQFSEVQKDLIKDLAATNRLAEAQGIILGEIERQYGGAAAAARDTLGGALKALSSEWGDLLEVIAAESGGGSSFRTAIEAWIRWIKWLKENFALLGVAWNNTVADIIQAMANFSKSMEPIAKMMAKLPGVADDMGDKFKAATKALNDMASGMRDKANAALDSHVTKLVEADTKNAEFAEGLGHTESAADDAADAVKGLSMEVRAFRSAVEEELATEAWLEEFEAGIELRLEEAVNDGILAGIWTDEQQAAWDQATSEMGDRLSEEMTEAFLDDPENAPPKQGPGAAVGDAIIGAFEGQTGKEIGENLGATAGQIAGFAIGMWFGGPFGAALGAKLGEAVGRYLGGLVGGMFDSDPRVVGFLGLGQDYMDTWGDLSEEMSLAGQEMLNAVNMIGAMTGGMLEMQQTMNLFVDETGAATLVMLDAATGAEVMRQSFESIEDAMEFGLNELIGSSVVQGASEMMGEAFQNIIEQASVIGIEGVAEKIQQVPQILDKLFGYFEATGLHEQERMELARAKVDIEFAILQQQLIVLGLWEQFADVWAEAKGIAMRNVSVTGTVELGADTLGKMGEMSADEWRKHRQERTMEIRGMTEDLVDPGGMFQREIDELREEFANFNATQKAYLEKYIDALQAQKANDITGRLLDFVKDNEKWAEDYQAFQEAMVRLEFEIMKAELIAAEAWTELAGLWADALDAALDAVGDMVDSTEGDFDSAINRLIDLQKSLITSSKSPLPLGDQLDFALSEFQDVLSAAQAGDVDAMNQLPGVINTLLDIASQMFGTTEGFDDIFNMVMEGLESVTGFNPLEQIGAGESMIIESIETTNTTIMETSMAVVSSVEALESEQKEHKIVLREVVGKLDEINRNLELQAAA
jgi:hypothetical protein